MTADPETIARIRKGAHSDREVATGRESRQVDLTAPTERTVDLTPTPAREDHLR